MYIDETVPNRFGAIVNGFADFFKLNSLQKQKRQICRLKAYDRKTKILIY